MMDATNRPPRALLVAAVLSLCLIAPARLHLLLWDSGAWRVAPLSALQEAANRASQNPISGIDLLVHTVVTDGRLKILQEDRTVWISPEAWTVADALAADLNHDGQVEMALVVWRAFEPWPIDAYIPFPGRIDGFHNHQGRSCHLILIGEQEGDFVELWAGSALADPIRQIAASDLDDDGRQELIALEGRYDDPLDASAALTVWNWNGFGFSLRRRGPPGRFSRMLVLDETEPERIVIQGHLRR
jgi:hypothetical protein